MKYRRFQKIAKFFRDLDLAEKPLNIRRSRLREGPEGVCEDHDDKFVIKVSQELPENHSIDVLIHELAHAIAWEKDVDFHGMNWGKAYSKVYRIFLENFT